ncbi:hypothetical protein ACKVDN_29315 (plasmid) [Escherichia coli]|uniref:hypothetical protein n=1 Tax=Escherichia coli TaxID=562 RepID=UPI003AB4984F
MQQIFGGQPGSGPVIQCNWLSDSYRYFYGSSQSASQIMRQNVTMNALKEGITSYAARNGDYRQPGESGHHVIDGEATSGTCLHWSCG